jgi:hypothetical protein
MSGGCSSRRLLGFIGVLVAGSLSATPVAAFEALNGRIQAHGFFESQMRVISEDYNGQWDVAQWYNVFNLELEMDIIRDTWGPIDLLSAFVRAEVRYDCVYSRGCGMFRSVNTYGDRSKSLPDRLNDATHRTKHGAIVIPTDGLEDDAPDPYAKVDRNPGRDPMPASQISIFVGISGSSGVDGFTDEDPCDPTNPDDPPCDYLAGSGEDVVDERVRDVTDDPWPYVEQGETRPFMLTALKLLGAGPQQDFSDFGFTAMHHITGSEGWLGPWLPKNTIVPIGFLAERVNPFKEDEASPALQAAVWNAAFLGAYDPVQDNTTQARDAAEAALVDLLDGAYKGALPFRPAPEEDYDNASATLADARGIYYPAAGLREEILRGNIDSYDFNLSESERAWNRGSSQQDQYELKEAYFDLETLDSHLWLRIGLQHIVWGKTELFRTTDQFNPQDLALESLPSLEESRIAQWALRGVYSFYQLGPLDDVRLELAINFDDYEPNDLGACGEAYTPNPVCESASWGAFTHGILGVGFAGADRPPSPWESLKGWEIGGRVEFRYDRFSFAISDFWGFSDMPYADLVSVYQRNVDPVTGRPRRAGINGPGSGDADTSDDCVTGSEPACLTPADALYNHHANQQMFSFICAATVGYSSLDPTACSLSIFNSSAPLAGLPIPTSQFIGAFLAGSSFVVGLLASPLAGDLSTYGYPLDLVGLNVDTGPAGTLTGTLTPEQQALVGCGPFWGTNCDTDGIDIMNSDASVLMQSWPGVEGTSYHDMNARIAELVQSGVEAPIVGPNAWETNYRVDADGNGTPDIYLDQPATLGWVVNRRGGPVGTAGDFAGDGSNPQLPGVRSKWTEYDRASQTGSGLNPDWDVTQDGDPDGLVHPFTLQPWANELAAVSWNLQVMTAVLSPEFSEVVQANIDSGDYANDTLAYAAAILSTETCGLVKPQLCAGTKGLLSIAGLKRNTLLAGGNGTYGRRTFQWHSGASVVSRYDKRNVLGFAMDFAEDRSKTNFNIEMAWISKYRMADNDSPTGLSDVSTYNLSVSMDRPTFIRFLNRSRTMFFNAQFFLQYIDGYQSSFPSNGPINFLCTASVGTAYFQDRLSSGVTTVFDAKSRSGAVMTGMSYRFTQSFSASLGAAWFFGREQLVDMPLVESTAALNRSHYNDKYEAGMAVVRDRDEVSLRLRYTF